MSNGTAVYGKDVDGDGIDLMASSFANNAITWYENDGSESFTKRTLTTSASGAYAVYASDLDSDGDVDILAASASNDTISWFANQKLTPTYTVSFDGNGTTAGGPMASTHLSPGATTKLPHLVFTRAGYTFGGWNTAANGSGTSYADKANITMGSGNVTLFAQWVAPPASSAYNSNTVLLLPGDGDLLDKSVSAHTVSALNGVATSTASPARGSGSVVFDGTDDFLSIPDSADFEFGSGAWSIDTWMNTNSTGSNHGLLRKHADAGNTGINWLLGDNHLGWFYYSHGGGVSFVDNSTISRASGWHHLALTYDGSNLRLFYDGTLVSTTALSLNIPDNTAPFIIGDASNYGSGNGAYQDTHFYLNGKLDEFRVTKGSAIYTLLSHQPLRPSIIRSAATA